MTVVLAYQGIPSNRQEAEAKLRRTLPDVVFTRKTSTVLEGQLSDDQVQQVTQDNCWRVVTPSYAEVRKPALNLQRMRAKLSGDK